MNNASELPKGAVRQGGKEELRASILKTYLLRIRTEKGDRVVRTILANAGIDASMVDNETGWVSTQAARRALRGICETLGDIDMLRHRGEWVVNAEALGSQVKMLRSAEAPIDAYQYLADNAREVTRVGSWDFELTGGDKKPAVVGDTPATPVSLGCLTLVILSPFTPESSAARRTSQIEPITRGSRRPSGCLTTRV